MTWHGRVGRSDELKRWDRLWMGAEISAGSWMGIVPLEGFLLCNCW